MAIQLGNIHIGHPGPEARTSARRSLVPGAGQVPILRGLDQDTLALRFGSSSKPSPAYPRGLEGVILDRTEVSDVDPAAATLLYRGYDISDLVQKSTFEETSYLLLNGTLPTRKELNAFQAELARKRSLSPNALDMICSLPKTAHPMDKLKTVVNFLALEENPAHLNDTAHVANVDKATSLIAKLPTVIAAIHRTGRGLAPIAPDPSLSHAENFLYMLSGNKPDPYVAKVFDKSLIAYADHGFNASTTAARVTASTLSDIYSAVASAIGTLKGPLHGGANEQVMRMLLEIDRAPGTDASDKAERWVMDALAQKKTIMGFGHREYKNGDPRAKILLKEAEKVARRLNQPQWPQLADAVRTVMDREMGKRGKQLPPNVDYPVGYLYHMLGLPMELFTPIFALARVTGWSAQVIEQQDNNRLIRPKADYQGARGLAYQPLDQR